MTNDNTLRWSGLAAAIGGPLWLLPWTGWLGDVEDATGFLMALTGMVLVGFGLYGLYRRLPAAGSSRRNKLLFGVALAGILLIIVSALGGLISGASISDPSGMQVLAILLAAGALFMIIGLAGMGLIAVSAKALGSLSFTPLLLAVALVGYLVAVGLDIGDPGNDILRAISDVVTIGCWLLFGVALWSTTARAADPALSR